MLAATPLVPDYQWYLEPIQGVEIECLPRLAVAVEKGRVGHQVMLMFGCLTPEGIFLTVDRALRVWIVDAVEHGLPYQMGGITSLFERSLCIGLLVV